MVRVFASLCCCRSAAAATAAALLEDGVSVVGVVGGAGGGDVSITVLAVSSVQEAKARGWSGCFEDIIRVARGGRAVQWGRGVRGKNFE